MRLEGVVRETDDQKAFETAKVVEFVRSRPGVQNAVKAAVEESLLRDLVHARRGKEDQFFVWAQSVLATNRDAHGTIDTVTNVASRALHGFEDDKDTENPLRQKMDELSLEDLIAFAHLDSHDVAKALEAEWGRKQELIYRMIDIDTRLRSFISEHGETLDELGDAITEIGPETLTYVDEETNVPVMVKKIARDLPRLTLDLRSAMDIYPKGSLMEHDTSGPAGGFLASLSFLQSPSFEAEDLELTAQAIEQCRRLAPALTYAYDDSADRIIHEELDVVQTLVQVSNDLGYPTDAHPVEEVIARAHVMESQPLLFRGQFVKDAMQGLSSTSAIERRGDNFLHMEWEWQDDGQYDIPLEPSAVVNAMFNAIRNAARDSVGATKVVVQCFDDRSNNEIIFRVVDNGVGIPDSLMELVDGGGKDMKVPLFTVARKSGSNSTGLGTADLPKRMSELGVIWSVVSNGKTYSNNQQDAKLHLLQQLGQRGTAMEWRVRYN